MTPWFKKQEIETQPYAATSYVTWEKTPSLAPCLNLPVNNRTAVNCVSFPGPFWL